MQGLVIGGTGPTGVPIVRGLLSRGIEPVVLHRGVHEVDLGPDVEHIHADPHFGETLEQALRGRSFALAIGTYGRLRLFLDPLRDKTNRLITVGGTVYESNLSRPANEGDPRLTSIKIYRRIIETEEVLLQAHAAGEFKVTHFRYPNLYGPRQLAPREWSVIRRLLDGRRRLIMLDDGLTLESRAYVDNAAHAVLLAVDKPDESAGQIYNVADETTPSDADRVRTIAALMGCEIELVSFPREAGAPAYYWGIGRSLTWSHDGVPPPTEHQLLDISKLQRELGYSDVLGYEAAMLTTVSWYLENRPLPGGEEETQLSDPFDYDAEDAFLVAHDAFVRTVKQISFSGIEYRHQYDHPKVPLVPPIGTERVDNIGSE